METLQSLSAAEQQMLVGLVVMIVVGLVRAIMHWRGVAVSETALSKLASYATVAGITCLATLIAQGGYSAEFWIRWVIALGTAVGGWEGLSKLYNATIDRDALDDLDAVAASARLLTKCLPALLLCALVACAWCAGPAVAADLPLPEATLVGSLDGGPTLGAAASWHVADLGSLAVWADIGVKREEAGTDWFAGASTPAAALLETLPVIRLLAPAVDRVFPAETRLGAGYLFDAREPWIYLATGIRF